ncbi:PAS domain-containing protein [Chryseolinea lacunae]|uniref:histidine kinase n=1 Tax=Chryseolinea lacunae TaxID=2801331 RepID=A0ABS1KXZ9_9BACT|nr:PAS domain-containing protein [Chryseolinea lacunae]MBL0744279.1 PAS domain-containing protein [Chryseolinea lacunae]
MTVETPHSTEQFLSGGGELGGLIRAKDWEQTPLGAPETWPQSLRTTLSILLSARFPMFLWWGPELIQFYNDAYRPSLGNSGKHPHAVGQRGEECWPEIWPVIGPLIHQVMTQGESVYFEDQLIPIYRNGLLEDVYWTFSYSPVRGESGSIEGVLVVCSETTEKVLNLNRARENERQLRSLVDEAPVSTAVFRGPQFVVELANDEALKLWGKDRSVMGKPVAEAIPELKGQPFLDLLTDVYATGKTYEGKEDIALLDHDGKLRKIYINFIYKALRDESGNINGILTMGYDVTDQVVARNRIRDAEERTRLAVDAAMLGTFDLNLITGALIYSDRISELFGSKKKFTQHDLVEAIHPLDRPIRDEAMEEAMRTGLLEYAVRIVRPDATQLWINVKAKIFFDAQRKPYRILGTVKDITEEKTFVDTIREKERKFRDTVTQAPVGIIILRGPDFMVEIANTTYLQIVDREEKDFVGRHLRDGLPEVMEFVGPLLTNVLATGQPYYGTEFEVPIVRHGKRQACYFNFVYHPLRDNNVVDGVMVVASEVTDQVLARKKLHESELRFRNLVANSPIAMAIFRSRDLVIEIANNTMLKNLWRRNWEDVKGRKLLDIFPELHEQQFPRLLLDVFDTGKPYRENEAFASVDGEDGLKSYYLDFEYAPLFDSDGTVSGIMVTVNDVSEKVEARQQIMDAAERLTLATEGTQLATWDLDLKTRDIIYSPRLARIFGRREDAVITHADMRNALHPEDRVAVVEKAFTAAMVTGNYYYEARVIHPDNSEHWIRTHGKVFYDDNRQPERMIGTMIDITETKRAEKVIEESEKKFRTLADSIPQFIWTADATGVINYFNQSVSHYTGLAAEQLFAGGWTNSIHPEERETYDIVWRNAVHIGQEFTFEHRMRRRDGEERWQLSRAVPQRDAAGKVVMWVGTSTDIHDRKIFTDQLESMVQQRTVELNQLNQNLLQSNNELAQFAYVASHDLQEPLRKIQTFATRILEVEEANLSDRGKDYFRRMQSASVRMQQLILDLLSFSRANTNEKHFERTDLNHILSLVKEQLKETIEQKHAVILSSTLPTLNLISFQFEQLFTNLIANALKFSRQDLAPLIAIHADIVNGLELKNHATAENISYHRIVITDNGIGFEHQFSDRIFQVFQRLHGKDKYPGTGIGLAICKKIVENHLGFIEATGELNKGAKFTIFIPANTE